MPRQIPGGNPVTQTRTFNYLVNNNITAYLQSATNPENGTVYYYYGADGALSVKWDAKGQQQGYFLQYARDSYSRVTAVETIPGTPLNPTGSPTVLRTYTYDTNPSDDPNYSQNAAGRLTRVQYNAATAAPVLNWDSNWITFSPDAVTQMYSYNPPAQLVGNPLPIPTTAD